MDDESEQPQSDYPLVGSTAKLSKTPSWVMLGFVLGGLFVYAMMRRDEASAPSTVSVRIVEAPKPAGPREAMPLSTIEAVFAVWGDHAGWWDDTTEVALWNKAERTFADYYEVRRISGTYYFRSIPALTRRIIRHGKELPDSPLQFTETEEQYREWLEHGRSERRLEGDLRPVAKVSHPRIITPTPAPLTPLPIEPPAPPSIEPILTPVPTPKK